MFWGRRNWRLNEWNVRVLCVQVDVCAYRCAVPSNKGKTLRDSAWFTFVVHISISSISLDLFPLIVHSKCLVFSICVSSAFGFIWLTLPFFFSFLNPTGDLAVTLANRLYWHSENILNIKHMLWVEAAWQVLCECVCFYVCTCALR